MSSTTTGLRDLPPLPELPVRPAVPAVLDALDDAGAAVLVAPPGTGKTTLVPLLLARHLADRGAVGRVVVAEPRRLAVRAAATRMASLLGSRVGEEVGYAMRGDRRTGPRTVVEVVTTGLLVARLQHDPELLGDGASGATGGRVDALVLDECHERHLDTDLALAFAVDTRAALRPDLRILATSATAAADRVAAALGAVPVIRAPRPGHDVAVVWSPPPRPIPPPRGLRVEPAMLDHVGAVIRRAVAEGDGDVLVFLPGRGEIDGVARRLRGPGGRADLEADVLALHGGQPAARQDAVLAGPAPGARRRVVLATAVAETSLTVPGVRAVVDAGLDRVPHTDHARGLDALVTVLAARASATQRAGRAGREAPGRVYRCWAESEHPHRPEHPDPEIAHADLAAFALSLARWGTPDGRGLALLDEPPAVAMAAAREVLRGLGAVDDAGTATLRGRAIAAVGAHPRLGRALLDGAPRVGARRAAEVVALLSVDAPGAPGGDDVVARWRAARSGGDERWRAEVRRLRAALPKGLPRSSEEDLPDDLPDDLAAGLVVGLAHPDRLARPREVGGAEHLMSGGTGATLDASSALRGSPWLAVADATRAPGERVARVRLAAAIDEATARDAGAALLRTVRETAWVDGDVRAEERDSLGAVVLTRRPLTHPDPADVARAVRDGLRDEGLGLLGWDDAARNLRRRLAFLAAALGPPWPEVDDESLLARVDEWLSPELDRARRRSDLARVRVGPALRRLLPWDRGGRLDELAPTTVPIAGGEASGRHRSVAVDYTDPGAPVVAVRVQQAFGWRRAPTIAGVGVVVHLLSPAGRPVAVTADLASFWSTGYPQVRAELRGRYPRHAWPEDPHTASGSAPA